MAKEIPAAIKPHHFEIRSSKTFYSVDDIERAAHYIQKDLRTVLHDQSIMVMIVWDDE